MAFDWSSYLEVARHLTDRADEASLWSAVSRAYYAAFGTAAQSLSADGHVVPLDGSAHEYVWSVYRAADNGPLYYIGQDGVRSRRRRRSVDYDPTVSISPLDAQKSLREAQSTVDAIHRHAAPIPREGSTESP